MAALAWLVIPLLGTICAVTWALWAARQSSEKGTGDAAGVAGYDAFRAAMEKQGTRRLRTATQTTAHIAPDGPSRGAE
ncbi:hypothetical protein JJV70_12960 [Streptomyces sp. JJ66]|uniref:hypothetical protein n=1 Tax=Streptomyces sp. JJ66 TaxID=2803843 RepID=UPI001C598986|nr:hypothetical protein [Streptomyces sp. JJ66]MBW1603001.1 hypothetical protein [Streptomyces sp. JJ66]